MDARPSTPFSAARAILARAAPHTPKSRLKMSSYSDTPRSKRTDESRNLEAQRTSVIQGMTSSLTSCSVDAWFEQYLPSRVWDDASVDRNDGEAGFERNHVGR